MINSGGWETSDQLLPGRASTREIRILALLLGYAVERGKYEGITALIGTRPESCAPPCLMAA